MRRVSGFWIFLVVLALGAIAAPSLLAGEVYAATPTTLPMPYGWPAFQEVDGATTAAQPGNFLVHVPGIGGFMGIDHALVAGLIDGGVQTSHIIVYDWTENDPGIDALHARNRNLQEAQQIADLITTHAHSDPHSKIFVTAHSGGCGVAVWALELLPADVSVDTVLLMAPALSPGYDLTKALSHVRTHVYAFSSIHDVLILYTGTKLFGTIDGVLTQAAGFSGFVEPAGANATEYLKLVPEPYQNAWMKLNNWGDHVGPMSRAFAQHVLAPLLEQTPASTEPSADVK